MTGTKRQEGFTLVELLFAVAIFVITVSIVATIYVTTLGNQRRAFATQDVLDNSRFALESMARAIRQSDILSATATTLTIQHPTKGQYTYQLSGGRLLEGADPLTSEDIIIEDVQFIVSGLPAGDGEHPRVTVIFRARSASARPSEEVSTLVQTTITTRNLQIP